MLAAHHRLRRSDDFRRTVRRGMRSSRPTLVVHELRPSSSARAVPGAETHGPAQVGFVVSRGVGNAVVRNQVTRRLRHLVGQRLNQVEPGSLIVVRAHPAASEASSATLGDDLDACLAALRARGGSSTSGRGRP